MSNILELCFKLTNEQIQEFDKCRNDICYFAENYFKVKTKDGYAPFKLYNFQKKVINDIVNAKDPKRHNIIVMHKDSGKTTLNVLYALHYALFNPDKCIALISHRYSTAIDFMNLWKESYIRLPVWLQPGLKTDTCYCWDKMHVILSNYTRIIAGTADPNNYRGRSVDLMIVDNMAQIEHCIAESFMRCVVPTMSCGKHTKMILSSTPNGKEHFYTIWEKTNKGETQFVPTFVNIYDDERYSPEDIEKLKQELAGN